MVRTRPAQIKAPCRSERSHKRAPARLSALPPLPCAAEWAACVAATEKKVAASLKKLNDSQRALETDASQLETDLRKAIKSAKAAAKESTKEIDDVKAAQTRVLRSHKEAVGKIVVQAEQTTKDIAARQLDLGGILREIGLVARRMGADGGL